MRRFLIALTAATSLAACSSADVGSNADYATDSFAKPTDHGELDFHGHNFADFTAEQRFHGWHFTLTGPASVQLSTSLHTANLDTMLYLYAADEQGKKTGPNIAKDDNGGEDGLSSSITKDLEAGTYYIQAKTKNIAMRGRFELVTACSGAGCPVIEPPSAEQYCDGAYEAIGKCMDDGATEEECAPHGADGLLCCNADQDNWFCEEICASDLMTATEWGTDYDALYDVVPEDDYSGLMEYRATAVNACASPDLEALTVDVVAGYDADLEDEGTYDRKPWVTRGDEGFNDYFLTEEVMTVLDALVGDTASQRFEASVDIPCPNCTDGRILYGVYYPKAGKLVELLVRTGGDS
ncbi:MAG: pre-peptidase C-terminal domain-containing protein [Myxococcales bacterium]|nr:pre-peptidase C-terminal domain-containing protein [Myxococcales bacterium]